jgi:hypothetical protein
VLLLPSKNYLILSIEIFTKANLCFLYYLRVAELTMAARAIAAAAPMLAISISAEALSAIEATLPEGGGAERRPDCKGGYLITLPHGVVDRLKYLREPGQSDVILRVEKRRRCTLTPAGKQKPRRSNERVICRLGFFRVRLRFDGKITKDQDPNNDARRRALPGLRGAGSMDAGRRHAIRSSVSSG